MVPPFEVPLLGESEKEEEQKFSVPLLSEESTNLETPESKGFDVPLLSEIDSSYGSAFKFRGGKKVYDGLVMAAEQGMQLPQRMARSARNAAMQDLINDIDNSLGKGERSLVQNLLLRGSGFKYEYEKQVLENELGLADRGNLNIIWNAALGSKAVDIKRQLNYKKLSREERLKIKDDLQIEATEHAKNTSDINQKYNQKKQKLWEKRGYNEEEISAVGGVSSLSVSLAGMAAAIYTRKPQVAYATLPYFGLVTQQETYENSIAKGLSDEDARYNSYIQGGSEVASELLTQTTVVGSLNKFMKGQKQTIPNLVKEGGLIFLAEGAGEQLNGIAQSVSDAYFDNTEELAIAWDNKDDPLYEGNSWSDILYERARLTSIATLVSGGGIVATNGAIKYNASKDWIKNSSNPQQTQESVKDVIISKELEKVALEQAAAKAMEEDTLNDLNIDPMEILAEETLKIEQPGQRRELADEDSIEMASEPVNEVNNIDEGLTNVGKFLEAKGYDLDKLNLSTSKDAMASIRGEADNNIKILGSIGFNIDINNVEETANKIDQFILDQNAKSNFITKPKKQVKEKLILPKPFVPKRARDFAAVTNEAIKFDEVIAAFTDTDTAKISRKNRTFTPGNSNWQGEIDNIGEKLWELGFKGTPEEMGTTDRPDVNETLEILEQNKMIPEDETKYTNYINEIDSAIGNFIQNNPGLTNKEILKASTRRSNIEIDESLERLTLEGSFSSDARTGEVRYFAGETPSVKTEQAGEEFTLQEVPETATPITLEDLQSMPDLLYDKYFDKSEGMPVVPEHEKYVPTKTALKPAKPNKPLVIDNGNGDGGTINLDGGSNITDDSWGIGYESAARQRKNDLEFYLQNVVGRVKDLEKARDRRADDLGIKRLSIAEKPSEEFARLPGRRNDLYKKSIEGIEKIIDSMKELDLYGDDVDLVARAMHAPERNKKIYKDKTTAVDEFVQAIEDNKKADNKLFDSQTGKEIEQRPEDLEALDNLKREAAKFQNNGSGIQTDEAYKILSKYGIEYIDNEFVAVKGSNSGQAYLDTVLQYHEYIKETVATYNEAGLIDEAVAEDYLSNANYKYYVPLSGFAADTNTDGKPNRKGKGNSIVGKENETAKGRTSLSASPLTQMSLQRQRAIDRSTKNDALIKIADLIRDDFKNNEEGFVSTIKPKEMEGVFGFKENGQQKYLNLQDSRLIRALNSYDAQLIDPISKAVRPFTRLQSALYTTLSPAFILFNFSRDYIAGGIALYTEQNLPGGRAEGQKILGKSLKNVLPRLAQFHKGLKGKPIKEEGIQEAFDLFNEYGASSGFVTALKEESINDLYENLKTQHENVSLKEGDSLSLNLTGNAKKALNKTGVFFADVNSSVENGIRLSTFVEFIKAENNGKIPGAKKETIQQAASLAKQLTIDYTTKGHIGAAINSHFIFFNAAMQSNIPLYRALGKDKKVAAQVGAGIAGSASLITLYNFLVSDEDETGRPIYENLSERFGNRYMIIMLPNTGNIKDANKVESPSIEGGPLKVNGRTVAFAIPQPLGFNIPYNIARNAVEVNAHEIFGLQRPAKTVGRAALDTFDNFSTGVMPIGVNISRDEGAQGFAKTAMRTITPSYAKPLAELASNENFFGAPITKEYIGGRRDLPNSSVITPYDNALYISIAQAVNTMTGGDNDKLEAGAIDLQPGQIEYIVNYYGGGPLNFMNKVVDNVHRATFDKINDVSKIPFVNTYAIQEQDGIYAKRFYKAIDDIEGKVTRYKIIKEKDPKLAQEYFKENENVLKMDYITDSQELMKKSLPKELRGSISKDMTDIRNRRNSIRDAEKTILALDLFYKDPYTFYQKTDKIKEEKRRLYLDLLKEYEKNMAKDEKNK